MLEKLWHTGFDVDSLDDAHTRYKISPIRDYHDIWKILGYKHEPKFGMVPRFGEKHTTSLAIPYPDPQTPGETLTYQQMIRVRLAETSIIFNSKTHRGEEQKYCQPERKHTQSHAEPYFLIEPEQWLRLYDRTQPLIITEGELKAASLGLAQVAAIGFPGAWMWTAGTKAGTNRIHPALDPTGPRAEWAIPVEGRRIYVVPDHDFHTNKNVREGFTELCNVLNRLGAAEVHIVSIPNPPRLDAYKGVDDYFAFKAGPRWSKTIDKINEVRHLIADLLTKHAKRISPSAEYPAYSIKRISEDILQSLSEPGTFAAVAVSPSYDNTETSVVGLAQYTDGRYILRDIGQTVGNTNGKLAIRSFTMQNEVEERYYRGWEIEKDLGTVEGKTPASMPPDHFNSTWAAVVRKLPHYPEGSLIEPMEGVEQEDKCLRIVGGVINLTKCLEMGADWERRSEWLLPPSHKWFSLNQIQVSLSNMPARPQAPIFMDLIHHAFDGDLEKIRTLQLFFGKIMTCPMFMGLQQFLCLYGPGGTGKSTLYRVLLKLIGGQNVVEVRARKVSNGQFSTSALPGKSLIVFTETPDYFTEEMADAIKSITGQDRITVEPKGRAMQNMYINADIITVGNQPPTIPMDVSAFKRRAVFLSMTRVIDNRDHRIEAKMMNEEMAGVFLWSMEGAAALHRGEKIFTPASCQDDLEDIQENVSAEERFVNSEIIRNPKGKITPEEIFEHYLSWRETMRMSRCANGGKKIAYLIRHRYGITSSPSTKNGVRTRVYLGVSFAKNISRAL